MDDTSKVKDATVLMYEAIQPFAVYQSKYGAEPRVRWMGLHYNNSFHGNPTRIKIK